MALGICIHNVYMYTPLRMYMDNKQFMILVYDMLKLQKAETTIGDFRRVVRRVIQEEEE